MLIQIIKFKKQVVNAYLDYLSFLMEVAVVTFLESDFYLKGYMF